MEDSPRGSRVTGRCLLEVSEHGGDVLAALEIEVCKVWRGDLTGEENGVTSRPADGSRNILKSWGWIAWHHSETRGTF